MIIHHKVSIVSLGLQEHKKNGVPGAKTVSKHTREGVNVNTGHQCQTIYKFAK
jgi:hypothetical protein